MSYAADNQTDRQIDRQTDRQTDSNILPTPTDIVNVGNNNNNRSLGYDKLLWRVIATEAFASLS